METGTHPFRYWIIDNWCVPSLARAASIEFPDTDWDHWHKYEGTGSLKYATKDSLRIPPACSQILGMLSSLDIESITGETGLFPDVLYHGGGMHMIPSGFFLGKHLDSNRHPIKGWGRKYSVVLYLSENWDSQWGGELELWDGICMVKKVECVFNPLVIFECAEHSFHSVAYTTKQATEHRKSLACFFWCHKTTGTREKAEFL